MGVAFSNPLCAQQAPPLHLEAQIALGEVQGRIDHLALDLQRDRLYVAELANHSLGIVDLSQGKVLPALTGLLEPQGVAYSSSTDTIYVADGGDGAVHLFHGADFSPAGRIDVGDDPDNIRVDAANDRVLVGYGNGGLVSIDPHAKRIVGRITLSSHPESFQLGSDGRRAYANVPQSREVAIVDLVSQRQIASWPTKPLSANFPLALDEAHSILLIVFRQPATLVALATENGSVRSSLKTCGDADDVFIDHRRKRAYVSCGEGFIGIYSLEGQTLARIAEIPTAPGARTSLFVPERGRLYLAVPKTSAGAARIQIYTP
jgi:hypothetical protein